MTLYKSFSHYLQLKKRTQCEKSCLGNINIKAFIIFDLVTWQTIQTYSL